MERKVLQPIFRITVMTSFADIQQLEPGEWPRLSPTSTGDRQEKTGRDNLRLSVAVPHWP